jgi:hydrogenase maturation factor
VCLGEYGKVVELRDDARAVVAFDGSRRVVSLAVLVAEGTSVAVGDIVMVSIGMVLRVVDDAELLRVEEVVR